MLVKIIAVADCESPSSALYWSIFKRSGKQCGSCSDGFVRNQLICIYNFSRKIHPGLTL